jgi:hypothetical protein
MIVSFSEIIFVIFEYGVPILNLMLNTYQLKINYLSFMYLNRFLIEKAEFIFDLNHIY